MSRKEPMGYTSDCRLDVQSSLPALFVYCSFDCWKLGYGLSLNGNLSNVFPVISLCDAL